MKSSKTLMVLAIVITGLVGMLIGITYAWYAYDNAESTISGKVVKESPTIIFAQTDQILSRNIMPIDDEDRYTYASKNSFTITLDERLKDYSSGVEIFLDNITMSEELKIANYKYELLENNETIASGNFSTIGNNKKLSLKPMTILSPNSYPETYTYDLYIWLSEDKSDQNNLMDKIFSAKVGINSAVKK